MASDGNEVYTCAYLSCGPRDVHLCPCSKRYVAHAVSCQCRCIKVCVGGLQIFASFCAIALVLPHMVLFSAVRLLFQIVRSHRNK